MSDTVDYIEEAKLRDSRFAVLANAIAIETDLRDNPVIKAILAAVQQDADRAMEDLSATSPLDHAAVSLLLVKVSTLIYIRKWLNTALMRGQVAEQAIRAQDEGQRDE